MIFSWAVPMILGVCFIVVPAISWAGRLGEKMDTVKFFVFLVLGIVIIVFSVLNMKETIRARENKT